jgi:hypothetical protein
MAGLARQHLSGSHGVLCIGARKARIRNPEDLIANGKGTIARTARLHPARDIRTERERQRLRQCAMPGPNPGIPGPDAGRMDPDENLACTRRRTWHILEPDDLRTSKHVDPIGFPGQRPERRALLIGDRP